MTHLLDAADPRLAPSIEPDELARLLAAAHPAGDELRDRDRMRAFLAEHPDALFRSCAAGHFTGSALMVDAAVERVLFLFHAKHRRWLQPGGHADGDANLASVALREATEETGIEGLRIDPDPIGFDVHAIPVHGDEPAHLHLDVRFLVVAPAGAEPVGNHESHDLAWFPPDRLGPLDLDPGTHRLVDAGLARARAVLR